MNDESRSSGSGKLGARSAWDEMEGMITKQPRKSIFVNRKSSRCLIMSGKLVCIKS